MGEVFGHDRVARWGHWNSTILSHAYHEMSRDIGSGAASRILYGSLGLLPRDEGLEDLRSAMLTAASDLYGAASPERRGVEQALADVGLDGSWNPSP